MNKVNFDSVRQVSSSDFFQLLDSRSRLYNLEAVATKDYVAFYYSENDKIHHIGFIRAYDFKCFIGGI